MPALRRIVPKVDYLAILGEAWAQHLAPREANAPTVISTFSGAGGSSLGYSMSGYREPLAVEWDDNAVATFKLNFPDVPVYHGDIAKLSVEQVLEMTGLQPGQLDVFDGSPPCQGFSTAGKRNIDDSRNQLFREYVRLLRGLKPKVFVMENVSGMVKGKMKLVFVEILKELKASGYKVSARLLNAMYFNVPQSRQRLIFIGVRNDLGVEPSHPKAMCNPPTVGDAISSLEFEEYNEALCHIWQTNSATANERIARVPEGGKLANYGYTFVSAYRRVDRRKPCPTLTAGGIGSCASGSSWYSHFKHNRGLSGREGARIASFPDGFVFVGKACDMCSRIGNSVPPLFMRAIAGHIRDEILHDATGREPVRVE